MILGNEPFFFENTIILGEKMYNLGMISGDDFSFSGEHHGLDTNNRSMF